MLRNYFKILLRNVLKNKAFTLINISGLTLGITCSLIMFLIVKEELGYNRYHTNLDSLYRIGHIDIEDGREYTQGGVPLPMPEAVKEEIVGLKDLTLVYHRRSGLVSVRDASGEIKFYPEDPGLVYVEPNFFRMFDWAVLEGDVLETMEEPYNVALTESLAKKYFPNKSALGQTVRLDRQHDLKVVAILEDAPRNSDMPFEFLVSMETRRAAGTNYTRWGSISSDNVLFVQLENGVDPERVEAQFPEFVDKHWEEGDSEWRSFVLSPFSDYHFDTRFGVFSQRQASRQMLWVYAIIGAFLIVTACFNFINMSTAMAVKRAKEVGMRKVLGSSRRQLVLRFLGETFFITLVALLFSMAFTERLMPMVINEFVGIEVLFNPLKDTALLGYLVSLLIVVSLLAGLYPAIVLSSAKPINALKGTLTRKGGGMNLRRVLVVFQFILCQLLIFGTIVAVTQMNFFRSADMGYSRDWILTLSLPERTEAKMDLWENDIRNMPGVEAYSFNSHPPFSGAINGTNVFYSGSDSIRTEFNVEFKWVDENYDDTYGLRLAAGEWLPGRDTVSHYVINQELARKMGFEDPNEAIGETMIMWGDRFPIIGVVNDFHTTTLSSEIEPIVLLSRKNQYRTLGVKVNPARAEEVIAALEETWYSIHQEYTFDYIFLDENIENFYEGEKQTSQMLTVFAGIAIFIGCLGLYGLVAFMANQRSKEIGIRKALGASVAHIVNSFSWEFVKLLALAFLVAAPLGYWLMNSWLQDYAYSISIGPAIFIISIFSSLIIALLTTGYRSFRAATVNPCQSLRDE